MQDGRCTKCGLLTVHTTIGISGRAIDRIAVNMWSFADVYHYVCVNCGYMESYLIEPDKLSEIADKWPQVEGTASEDAQNTRRLR